MRWSGRASGRMGGSGFLPGPVGSWAHGAARRFLVLRGHASCRSRLARGRRPAVGPYERARVVERGGRGNGLVVLDGAVGGGGGAGRSGAGGPVRGSRLEASAVRNQSSAQRAKKAMKRIWPMVSMIPGSDPAWVTTEREGEIKKIRPTTRRRLNRQPRRPKVSTPERTAETAGWRATENAVVCQWTGRKAAPV